MRILPIITLNRIKKVLTKTKELVKPNEYKLINFQVVDYRIDYSLTRLPSTDIIDILYQGSGANSINSIGGGIGGGGGAFCHVRIRNPNQLSYVFYFQPYDDFRIYKQDGSYVRFSTFRFYSEKNRGGYISLNMDRIDLLRNFPQIGLQNVVKGGDGAPSNTSGESVSTIIELLDRTIYVYSKGGSSGGGAAVLGEGGSAYGGGGNSSSSGAPGCLIIYHYRKIGG